MSPVALVTGACSGIGLAIAHELGRRGYPLLLVSDRPARLAEAAAALQATHGVAVDVVGVDLARPDAAAQVVEAVSRRSLVVEILVNNAGIFAFGEVADSDAAQAQALLQLHVVTPSLLARHFARKMRERGRGYLLFVASIAAWGDFPGIALYGASKRYLRSFAAALREELAVYGVVVTCLAPGATATNLYAQTGVPVALARRLGIMRDPEAVARAGVRGMFAGRAVVVPGLGAKLMAGTMRSIPRWMVRLVRRHGGLLPRRPQGIG